MEPHGVRVLALEPCSSNERGQRRDNPGMEISVATPYYSPSRFCKVCYDTSRAQGAYLCDRCYRILHRAEPRIRSRGWTVDKEARFWAMKDRWDRTRRVFICYFTGLVLSDDDRRHPLYATWEHLQPETTDVTLAAAFVNSMKTNLTEPQFRQITAELVRVWSSPGSTFEPSLVPPWPWRGRDATEVTDAPSAK
jgi:hypothetical protein